MGQHTEALEQKISNTRAEIEKIQQLTVRVTGDLGVVLAQDPTNEKVANGLQAKRDELSRALERCELRLQTLTKEMPSAERQDAASRLNEIMGETQALAVANSAARERYEAALKALAECIDSAFGPALRRQDLQAEAEYWAEAFNLPMPQLPEVTQPEPGAVKVAYVRCAGHYELLFQVYRGPWAQKLSELQGERKRAAARSRAHLERESGARIAL